MADKSPSVSPPTLWVQAQKPLEKLLDKIQLCEEEADRLKDSLRRSKLKIPKVLVEHLRQTKDHQEAFEFLNELYWWDRRLDHALHEACQTVFNCRFTPEPQPLETCCPECGCHHTRECKSWRSLDALERHPECKPCLRAEWRKRHVTNEAEALEDLEEEKREEAELHRLRTMPYKDYLQTDHWKHVRGRALRKAYYRCQLCNSKERLDVHHRSYERRGCEWLSDLIALCRTCHEKHHDIVKEDKR